MKAIWAIVAGLGAMGVLSFVMVFVTLTHPPKPRTIARRCNCAGQCGK